MEGIRIGTAAWTVPPQYAELCPGPGSHLERYARRFDAVEINSSFYRPHRPATYARWAAAVPDGFRFAVKLPKEITHARRLADAADPLARFLGEAGALGDRLGSILAQLPPSLAFHPVTATAFLGLLRDRHSGPVAWEPRHPSWFAPEPEALLRRFEIARVAADPALAPGGGNPGGWDGFAYWRLHGSPRIYYSPYTTDFLDTLATNIRPPAWCIFDNTARGEATNDALRLIERLRHDRR
ncbi:MAG TPA: DUF72 domain-containing protein [Acetobacteraceae bacterium]